MKKKNQSEKTVRDDAGVRRYRKIRAGWIIKETDEYISFFGKNKFVRVAECTVGQKLLDCNTKYYRRPISRKLNNN